MRWSFSLIRRCYQSVGPRRHEGLNGDVLLLSLAKFMRRTRAATVIQKNQRMYVEKKRYRQKQAAALAMQTILRAYMARQKYQAVWCS